jgi:uridine kinase
MPIRPPEFDSTAQQLAPHLANLPGKLIAIDGRDGSGKTTLGRFLAWYFNVALVETDLFLREGAGLAYHTEQIERIVAQRLAKPRPVIVEGVTVLKTLQSIGRTPDLLIYVTNSKNPESDSFSKMFSEYEATFSPQSTAHVSVQLAH